MVHKIKTQLLLKIFSVFLFLLLLGSYANIFAVFNGNPYAPGGTLDPECAPTDTNCIVSGNPWLTSSGGIYYDQGNVNVGGDDSNINTEIQGSIATTTSIINNFLNIDSSEVTLSDVSVDQNGNPVIVYMDTESMNIKVVTCNDSTCDDSSIQSVPFSYIDNTGVKFYLKIDSDNNYHILYSDDNNINYFSCPLGVCPSSIIPINEGDRGSLALDSNNNPYIIFSSFPADISIARYTGSGIESSCSYYNMDEDVMDINLDWSCSVVLEPASGGYYLDFGSMGDSMYIGDDGYPRFIASYFDGNISSYITYNQCSDIYCSNVLTQVIDSTGERNTASSLSVNSDGIPYIAYVVGQEGEGGIAYDNNFINKFSLINTAYASASDAYNIFIAYPENEGGSGCSELESWTCRQITDAYETYEDDGYYYLDMKIDNNDLPQISATRYTDDNEIVYLDYIKCSNEECSSATISNILSESYADVGSSFRYLASPIAVGLDNDDVYFSYINHDDLTLNFLKSGRSEGTPFSTSNSLYSGGDLGVSGNLFVDGSIVTPAGLYLNSGEPSNTSSSLYNVGGELYWNGSPIQDISSVPYADEAGYSEEAEYANYLANTRKIYGNSFNGTANVTGTISASYGGTGRSTLTANNLIVGNGVSSVTFIAPSTSGNVLTSNGTSWASSALPTRTVAQGGTGLTTLTANNLIVGNGTSNVTFIAPSTSGNVLTSNGTSWVSSAPTLSSNSNYNTLGGTSAGANLVTGAQYNTFLGYQAGISASSGGTNTADYNIAIGYQSLYSNTIGYNNTSIGSQSLYFNTTGSKNTANGYRSLYSNTTGYENATNGYQSLNYNTTGYQNTANGNESLYNNTTGNFNTANGYKSLYYNTTGLYNSAQGYKSLYFNTSGHSNTAQGGQSLYFSGRTVTAGSFIPGISYTIQTVGTTDFTLIGSSSNQVGVVFIATGVGSGTGTASSNSNNNVGVGLNAGTYIANGSSDLTSPSDSVFLGRNTKALIDGSTNEIVIGYNTTGNGSNTTTIGTGNVLYIGGSSITGKVARFTNSAGYCDIDPINASLSCSSDINLKKNITILNKENIDFILNENIEIPDTILEKINLLTPVTYNWNGEEDTDNKHIGFIAQEVEQIFPDLIFTDSNTGLKSIAYSNLIPYTIKAIQEMNLIVKDLSSLDTDSATSLGSLIKSFLEDELNGIRSVFFGEVHTKQLCIDGEEGEESLCITKDQLEQLLNNSNISEEESLVPDSEIESIEENSPSGGDSEILEVESIEENSPSSDSSDIIENETLVVEDNDEEVQPVSSTDSSN